MSVLAQRLTAQLVAGVPARDQVAVVGRLLAIQAQDGRGARLAIRARSTGVTAPDIDESFADRSLLVTWLNRGTLHLVRREDYPWLHALTTPLLQTGNGRRLSEEGVSPAAAERGVAAIVRSLAEDGPLDRDRLRERVSAAGVRTEGQGFVHLLGLASIRGLIVRGPMIAGKQAFVLARDWLGEPAPIDRDRALAELARRYLAGHGPANPRDLAWWAGLPLRDVATGLDSIASELDEREDGLVDLKRRPEVSPLPEPRLLGPFEPILLGWKSRDLLLGNDQSQVISGGIFRAFALVRGRAAATWTISRNGLELKPFGRLNPTAESVLETEAEEVKRFLSG